MRIATGYTPMASQPQRLTVGVNGDAATPHKSVGPKSGRQLGLQQNSAAPCLKPHIPLTEARGRQAKQTISYKLGLAQHFVPRHRLKPVFYVPCISLQAH